jgi:cytochrome c oxidase subunit 2
MGAMLFFAVQYRKKSGTEKTLDLKGSHTIEFVWAVFPSFLLIAMFVMGFKTYVYSIVPPADSMEILVTGKQWNWTYVYPNYGIEVGTADAVVVPKGKAVRLRMVSEDVIHSYYVPDFRVKKDVVPNRYSMIWFETTGELKGGKAYMLEDPTAPLAVRGCTEGDEDCADGHGKEVSEFISSYAKENNLPISGEVKVGIHQVYCTEYCGRDHSRMLSKIVVLEPEHFEIWLKAKMDYSPYKDKQFLGDDGKPDLSKVGSFLAKNQYGCMGCHGKDSYPQWNTLYDENGNGNSRGIVGQGDVTTDYEYISESIRNPQAKVVAKYANAGNMSNYSGMPEQDVKAIVEYMKSLK